MPWRHAFVLGICAFGCSTGTPNQGTTDPVVPMFVDAGPFDCFGLTNCANACSTQSCFDGCATQSTSTAQSLSTTLQDCITTACPDADGGPCEFGPSGICQTCVQTSQTAGQQCSSDLAACIDDMSGSAGNQVGSGCSSLGNCLGGCQDVNCDNDCYNASSSLGFQLYSIFILCLNQTCPDNDGGACSDPTSQTCGACQNASVNGGSCADDYDNCQNSP
jgi:hypothetical protein